MEISNAFYMIFVSPILLFAITLLQDNIKIGTCF